MSQGLRSFIASLAMLATLSALVSACGKKKGSRDISSDTFGHSPYDLPSSFFSPAVSQFYVEVAYEVGPTPAPTGSSSAGAEPYVGQTATGYPYWSILEDNLKSATAQKTPQPTITVPKSLAEMRAIPNQNKLTWTPTEIYGFAEANRLHRSTPSTGSFFILFLTGYLDDDSNPGSPNTNVIGVSLSGSTVIAIFKPVVRSSGNNAGLVPKYVEQSTMVHEIGHALGLVNNGIPMTTSHQDSSHGAHCNNPNCVMYWENEGVANLRNFIQQIISGGSTTIYGSECLNDINAYQGSF